MGIIAVLVQILPYVVVPIMLWVLRRELHALRPKARLELTVAIALYVFTAALALGTFVAEPLLLVYLGWSSFLALASTGYALVLVLLRRDGGGALPGRTRWIYWATVIVFLAFAVLSTL